MTFPEPLKYEDGWLGAFTREQAKGAIPNGTRVEKTKDEPGDAHKAGAQAKVLGSLKGPPEMEAIFGTRYTYFVEWDDTPKTACNITGNRIKLIGQ